MTSRERVLAALNHVEPDRIPIDLSGHRSSGIAAIVYPKLRDYLGLPPRPVRVYDVIQQLAVVDADVLDRFGVDCIELGRGFALGGDDWKPWTLPDGTNCFVPAWTRLERRSDRWVILSNSGRVFAHMPDGTLYFEQTYYPLAESDDLNALDESSSFTSRCSVHELKQPAKSSSTSKCSTIASADIRPSTTSARWSSKETMFRCEVQLKPGVH